MIMNSNSTFPILTFPVAGTSLRDNRPIRLPDPFLHLDGTCYGQNDRIEMNRGCLQQGTLFEGAIGSGKTYAISRLVTSLRTRLDDTYSMIILDIKGDYYDRLYRSGDYVLGKHTYTEADRTWNLFRDIVYSGWDEDTIKQWCMEFAIQMFKDKKNQAQPFFTDAASLLLYAVLLDYIRQGSQSLKSREQMTNRGLLEYFQHFDKEGYAELLSRSSETGILKMMLGDLSSHQALGVLGETATTIMTTLTDVFGNDGDFSVREFVNEKENRCLFLEFDPVLKESQERIYGILIDFILKEIVARENQKGKVILVCDELPTIGKIDLSYTLNLGREKGFIGIVGIQSVAQIYDIYGEMEGESMLAGFCNKFLFSPNDEKTRQFVIHCFGTSQVYETRLSAGGCRMNQREAKVVEEYDLSAMRQGDFICSIMNSPPFMFHLS